MRPPTTEFRIVIAYSPVLMNLAIAVWTVIGLALLVVVGYFGGPVVALPLIVAVVVVYLLVRRSRGRA